MFHRLLTAYKSFGYDFHIGNNTCLCAALSKDGEFIATGGGASISDIMFFSGLSKIFTPKKILCIGNAAGYGTFCLAEIFENASIDAIDAETEGVSNEIGSYLTREISSKYYNSRVNLQKGFSPQDLSLFKNNNYDLIFLDGLHTDDQQIKDYSGVVPYASNSSVIYLHDVGLLHMEESYEIIRNNKDGFSAYNIDFTAFGCKALVRNLSKVEDWFRILDRSPLPQMQNPISSLRLDCIQQPLQQDQIPLVKK